MPTLHWTSREIALEERRKKYSLIHDPELSTGVPASGNQIIQGDNLDVLPLLAGEFHGKVKCIYIDPPYNTKESFEHFDDRLSHENWLAMMHARLTLLRDFLTEDGSLWVSIDDNEVHYLKVLLDELFGRKNFVSTIVWQQRTTRENRKVFSNNHDYILVYARDYSAFKRARNQLELSAEVLKRYKNPDDDSRGLWQSISATVQAGHATPTQFYTLVAPNGMRHELPNGRCWVYTEARMQEEIAKNNIWFGKNGKGAPRIKKFLPQTGVGMTPETLWLASEVETNDLAKKHLLQLFPDDRPFDTPKPEALIKRILHIATNPDDLVLDAFLGSGTTAAVAHKMGRRYIGIECGTQVQSHCIERLRKVIEGEQGGISSSIGWKGGGGFDFFQIS
jgi:adenine-specific DNA-methyltransferase